MVERTQRITAEFQESLRAWGGFDPPVPELRVRSWTCSRRRRSDPPTSLNTFACPENETTVYFINIPPGSEGWDFLSVIRSISILDFSRRLIGPLPPRSPPWGGRNCNKAAPCSLSLPFLESGKGAGAETSDRAREIQWEEAHKKILPRLIETERTPSLVP